MAHSIELEERTEDEVVAKDESTGIEARGDSVPTALRTLSEKLEVELYRSRGQ